MPPLSSSLVDTLFLLYCCWLPSSLSLSFPSPSLTRTFLRLQVSYSNFGYCLLGRVIERVSGLPYAAFVEEAVLRPLGMHATQMGRSLFQHRHPEEAEYCTYEASACLQSFRTNRTSTELKARETNERSERKNTKNNTRNKKIAWELISSPPAG